MIEEMGEGIRWALGLELDPKDLSLWQMVLRAIIIYLAALAMVRIGNKRFLGRLSAFDVILGIILGSVMSRAINGSAPFFPTIGAGFALVGLHWLFSQLAFRFQGFDTLVKGNARRLIQDGQIQWDNMQASSITQEDLVEELRLRGQVADLSQVQEAYLERQGGISVIPRDRQAGS